MPTNLHALIRYRTIDRCLRQTEYAWSWESLADACADALKEQTGKYHGISRRTIMYDIENMKSGLLGYHAPIEYDRKEKSYFYTNNKFSIETAPLRGSEMEELRTAMLILRQFSGKQNVQGLEEAITRLEETLRIRRKGVVREIIQFDHSLNEPGQRWISQAYRATSEKKSLFVTYQPFQGDPESFAVSPLLLREYNNRWFLFSWRHDKKLVVNLALDRVQEMREALERFRDAPGFDSASYFKDIVGVSIPPAGKKQKIGFKVYGVQKHYLLTKPPHPSLTLVKEKGDEAHFTMELIPNYELETFLIGLGEHIEVTEPKALRERIATRLREAASRYGKK
jgi:predicted DNA-binding transcriptional regulator YafY